VPVEVRPLSGAVENIEKQFQEEYLSPKQFLAKKTKERAGADGVDSTLVRPLRTDFFQFD